MYAYMCEPVACERQKVLDSLEVNFCYVALWVLGINPLELDLQWIFVMWMLGT